MKTACFTISILFFVQFKVHSQNEQDRYLNGKELFQLGRYSLAMEALRPLTSRNNSNPFSEYASFYYALSAYNDGQIYVARDMFLQIEQRFNTWRKMDEVNLWLAHINFELKNYALGLTYVDRIVSNEIVQIARDVKRNALFQLDSIELLQSLLDNHQDDVMIAEALVFLIDKQTLLKKDLGLMEKIVNEYDLDRSKFNVPDYSDNIKKDEYNVAVLLPFMYSSLEDTRQIMRNSLVTSLYEGMLLAEEELNSRGMKVNLLPYDTKRNEDETLDIINRRELPSMDQIIGPLYPEPSRIVSQFSYDNRINMINPLSSNTEVIGNNPYSFLFKPATETQAVAAAEFSRNTFTNKTSVVIYEDNERDSLFAHIYKTLIEEDSFQIVYFRKFTAENVREATDTLTATYESDIPEEKVDSLLEIENYPIKLKRKEDPQDPDEYYEELLVIAPDSIGHILTASSNVVFAANSLSMVNVRGDSIPLIGREEWLQHSSLGLDQLEQLGIYLISPTFYNENSYPYREFRDKILEKYSLPPNQYHVIGYELVWQMGNLMHRFGKYIQVGIRSDGIFPGRILQGVKYNYSNDNQVVPMIQFKEAELTRIDQNE